MGHASPPRRHGSDCDPGPYSLETLRSINLDILVRAFYDLQIPDEDRRLAAALRRISPVEDRPIPLSQTELGLVSNVSRKQVNAALKKFEIAGWISKGYRTITIADLQALSQFAERPDEL